MHWIVAVLIAMSLFAIAYFALPSQPPDSDNLTQHVDTALKKITQVQQLPAYPQTPDNVKELTSNVEKTKNTSWGEAACRHVLERLFSRKFTKKRPNFLKNPETGRNLELDCYNEELGLAVEYNGYQHYHWPNFTGQTKEAFKQQVRRDKYKRIQCKRNGVMLLVVPYTVEYVRIGSYIWHRLSESLRSKVVT